MSPIRLLSFDVGIKNLAYCIVDISQNDSLQLIEWNVLNLCVSEGTTTTTTTTTTAKCHEVQKNGKTCGKPGKYCKKENTLVCCEKHAKTSITYKIPQKEHAASTLKKLKIDGLRELAVVSKLNAEGKKEDILQALNKYFRETEWEVIQNPKKQNASKTDLITLGRSLHAQLSANPIMSTVTHVIIENQISPIANRMKTIQGMIAQHFISLGNSSIEFVSSGNKLKNLAKQSNATTGYKQNKQDGIFYCDKYLRENQTDAKWLDILAKSPKKDDLSDCFLQALWWKGKERGKESKKDLIFKMRTT